MYTRNMKISENNDIYLRFFHNTIYMLKPTLQGTCLMIITCYFMFFYLYGKLALPYYSGMTHYWNIIGVEKKKIKKIGQYL